MARLRDDQIQWILSLDAKGVQSELKSLSSRSKDLTRDNKLLEAELKAANKQMRDAQREMDRLTKAGKTNTQAFRDAEATYNSAASDVADYTRRISENTRQISENNRMIDEMVRRMRIQDMTMTQLKKRAKELQRDLENTSEATHPEEYAALSNQLDIVRNRMGELNSTSESTFSIFKGGLAVFAGNLMTKAVDKIKEWIDAGIEFVKTGIDMANSAEGQIRFFKQLSGSSQIMRDLKDATSDTISEVELMDKTLRAKELGIPIENMATLMDFARRQAQKLGEEVDYMADSIVDGLGRKSILILDNLGISSTKVQAEVKKTGDFTQAVIKIVNEELEKQGTYALTAADKAAQSSVKWENAQLKVGQKFQWLSGLWNQVSGDIADKISDLAGDTDNLSDSFKSQLEKVADLELNTAKLARRYDELKGKASLNKDEQAELNRIMNILSNTVPGVITQFDQYGNVLAINTAKVYDFIDAQKAKLKILNAENIEEQTQKLKFYTAQVAILQEQLKSGETTFYVATGRGPSEAQRRKMTEKEYENAKKEYDKYLELQKGTQGILDDLNGTTIEKQVENQKKMLENRAKFNAMNKADLQAWLDDEKNAVDEFRQIAQQIYDQRFGTNPEELGDQAEKDAERKKKALDKQLQDIDDYVVQEKNKLAQQRLDNILSHEQYLRDQERLELEALAKRMEVYKLDESAQREILNKILEYRIKIHEAILEEEELFKGKMGEVQTKTLDKGIKSLKDFGTSWMKQQSKLNEDALKKEAARRASLMKEITGFAENTGNLIGGILTNNENIVKSSLKAIINMALDALKAQVQIAIAGATAQSLAQPDSVLTFGAAGFARAAILIGLIEAAFAVAKTAVSNALDGGNKNTSGSNGSGSTTTRRVVTPGYFDGGYTGSGNKYDVKGYLPDGSPYHADEYMIPKEEFRDPVFAPMIRAIENSRRKRTGSNPLPGGYADGGYIGDNSGSDNTGLLYPDMAGLTKSIGELNQLLAYLKAYGVGVNIYEFVKQQDMLTDFQNFAKKG